MDEKRCLMVPHYSRESTRLAPLESENLGHVEGDGEERLGVAFNTKKEWRAHEARP